MNQKANIIISLADFIQHHIKDAVDRFDLSVFACDSLYAGYRNKSESIQIEIFRVDQANHEVTIFTPSKGITRIVKLEDINEFIIDHVNI